MIVCVSMDTVTFPFFEKCKTRQKRNFDALLRNCHSIMGVTPAELLMRIKKYATRLHKLHPNWNHMVEGCQMWQKRGHDK